MANPPTSSSVAARGAVASAATSQSGESIRESLEAIVVAIILTLTFRTFLGENYQIPTGSMAPTLQGRHMDVVCPECSYQYRTGASQENEDNGFARSEVTATACPICHYRLMLDKKNHLNERSFGGDRIIVSKLAYAFSEPQRWDVFVFKYPGNPKINYIKRLVGLPGETLLIRHGDVFTATSADGQVPSQQEFKIARKPGDKVGAMLQLVDDTYYRSVSLREFQWPQRWIPIPFPSTQAVAWQTEVENRPLVHTVKATSEISWLGYRHLIPRHQDWQSVVNGADPDLTGYQGQLITDYYEYNDSYPNGNSDCFNWVGDLAFEAHANVLTDSGELLFDIVEGGIHHQCRIDIASGKATMTLDDDHGRLGFGDDGGDAMREVSGQSAIRGRGTYTVRFANVDDQLFLWVNDKLVSFSGPTSFVSPRDLVPRWSEQDPGDFMPVRIGVKQAEVRVHRLRVFRDVYYIAAKVGQHGADSDYGIFWAANSNAIQEVLSNPQTWATTDLFTSRREVTYTLEANQFFPMGDNSPQSKDGRLWSHITPDGLEPPPFVERKMLIGKAVFIYWPHGWRILTDMVGVIPNYQRIGTIR